MCSIVFTYELEMFLSSFIATLFCLYLYRLFFTRGMEGRRSWGRDTSRGRGSSLGRGAKQAQELVREPREVRGETVEPQPGL